MNHYQRWTGAASAACGSLGYGGARLYAVVSSSPSWAGPVLCALITASVPLILDARRRRDAAEIRRATERAERLLADKLASERRVSELLDRLAGFEALRVELTP